MTTLSNNTLQAGIVTKLKATSALTTLLASSAEIKEDQWHGRTFTYPAVRVELGTLVPGNAECTIANFDMVIQVYSEDDSSKNCDAMCGVVANTLHRSSFSATGVRFVRMWVTGIESTIRKDERTWLGKVNVQGLAQVL